MSKRFKTEATLTIYDESIGGTYLKISPDGDGLGLVEVRAYDNDTEHSRISMPTEMAKVLAEALVNVAEEIEYDEAHNA